MRGLTFELSGRRRQDARPGPVKMYRVPPARAWWPAVGAPLERGVRPRLARVALGSLAIAQASVGRIVASVVLEEYRCSGAHQAVAPAPCLQS